MWKVKRGDFGYIRARKKRALFGTLLMIVLGVAVFLTGLFLNEMSNRNIFTVVAVLFVLPGAKFLVAYIVLFPYHSVTAERYELVKGKIAPGVSLYTDLVITSAERVMHLDFAVVGNGQVVALLGNGKQELSYVRQYITQGVQNWGPQYRVKVLDQEKRFLAEAAAMGQKEASEADEEQEAQVRSYLTSLIV